VGVTGTLYTKEGDLWEQKLWGSNRQANKMEKQAQEGPGSTAPVFHGSSILPGMREAGSAGA